MIINQSSQREKNPALLSLWQAQDYLSGASAQIQNREKSFIYFCCLVNHFDFLLFDVNFALLTTAAIGGHSALCR